ncbi:MAG: cold shock domain-containing protein [Alphaproteobacteria bacterium]|nr:cold shock domain-containing protein [Alphaproteobacteria bacterium]MBU0858376.1 cold shock domain-containing protein [Alphaproteobacteria bacterium]
MQNEGSAEELPVKTRLKWFNNPKGFGFVCPEDENLDAFLHITTLQKAGVSALGEGACLVCLIERGPKGAQVKEVLELIDAGTLPEAAPKTAPPAPRAPLSGGDIIQMGGTVKWYKLDKGFGFVVPDDGMKDIFIHKTCLERHGHDQLIEGQRLMMTIRNVPKGREVLDFTIES